MRNRQLPSVLAFISFAILGSVLGRAQETGTTTGKAGAVTAIDVLLEPDDAMVKKALAANERLLQVFPQGFALGRTHAPHMSMLQRYVKTVELEKVYQAVGNVLAQEKPAAWKLTANRYDFATVKNVGIAVIMVERTDELVRCQKKLIDAISPFTVKSGTAAAFATTKADPDINQWTIDYVADFVPKASGKNFEPHVTIGLAPEDYLKRMCAEKFEAFTFAPAAAAVYHLGNFGTARTKLKSWNLKRLSAAALQARSEPRLDPLPSWNEGRRKQAILAFVKKVTDKLDPDYVLPVERIAVFDNDGTLWSEQPMTFQIAFALDRVKALAPKHPEWTRQQPFQAILEGDLKALAASGEKGLMELLMATHAGMTTEDFEGIVKGWLASARHPRFKRPYTELVYQPMLELLACLRANAFKTYIVSGGGIEFMRPWMEKVYGIPREQIIGSRMKHKFEMRTTGPVLIRLAAVDFYDDGPDKPVGIFDIIGRVPIFAFGNSDGDKEMLEWTAARKGASFMGIVHHTDGVREYSYDRASQFGRLDKALDEGRQRGWSIVDMKHDWKVIYPFDK